ncbi:TetR/AcrR family transcriptional regulator [Nocardia farcinica]|uniref:Potential acrAB operon repressor n=2 Tax=Nocardia farcinica TaxID=37329 RepID=A0A449GG68_NOCFR|nr:MULTISPECIES: TetR/AcrR family transcriptional regulator [Nocardia]MBA4859172.1 TetR/AcrR family transcriptional regulator [Nocardia farcinica]MBC9818401.1 TetR/AcrR family transcriptional regulator [Nocardia farcinica]MBF6070909.1 TetR/AcrR family transcriptional regulator [Nocardia farcinica]MBF6139653.1 TetR/AcrR family transcriptional regulator [Nocardia farcinica]MBF6185544.1 TetR/AcrR family transcriptional regulator [Nocardia farcinica]
MPSTPGSRRRPTQERAKATRELILDTAARLFGERGIDATSTNRIAAEAGVSVGTVYRYFADRTVIVEELLERLLEGIERRLTERLFGMVADGIESLAAQVFEALTEELVAHAPLVRALVGGVQFYNSGIPEFEQRLRVLVKVMIIQLLGPGDDRRYDTMTFVLINTGFATVLRASALEVGSAERRDAITLTARMIGAWAAVESADPTMIEK